MSYSDWKKRTKIFSTICFSHNQDADRVAQAAYKAGVRDGLNKGEDIAKTAIELRDLLKIKSDAKTHED